MTITDTAPAISTDLAADSAAPVLRTELPGPIAAGIIARDDAVTSPSLTRLYPLVAKRGRTIAFIEVKARRTGDAGIEAISPQGRARIARAAEAYVSRYPAAAALTLRFDVIAIAPWRWPRHLVGAFGAGGAL